jgi:hypothetical protein
MPSTVAGMTSCVAARVATSLRLHNAVTSIRPVVECVVARPDRSAANNVYFTRERCQRIMIDEAPASSSLSPLRALGRPQRIEQPDWDWGRRPHFPWRNDPLVPNGTGMKTGRTDDVSPVTTDVESQVTDAGSVRSPAARVTEPQVESFRGADGDGLWKVERGSEV